jgi:hypothetical protein
MSDVECEMSKSDAEPPEAQAATGVAPSRAHLAGAGT